MADVTTYADSVAWGPPETAQRIGPLAVEWLDADSDWHVAHDGPCALDSRHAFVWHDCTAPVVDHDRFGWRASGIANHTVVTVEPLTVVASLYWPDCCGLHGFITDGKWVGA